MIRNISIYSVVIALTLYSLLVFNGTFWQKVITAYSLEDNFSFLASIVIIFACALNIFWAIIVSRATVKNLVIVILLVSSVAAYFMNAYGVAVDSKMIQNMMASDTNEISDLLSIKMMLFILGFGVIPSFILYKLPLKAISLKKILIQKGIFILGNIAIIVLVFFLFSKSYASFFREHKMIRYYSNPTYWVYSSFKYLSDSSKTPISFIEMGDDAEVIEEHLEDNMRELVIMVVGETARSDRFSLNGYSRVTNPELQKEDVLSFTDVTSCGTSTAVSVPCMFSVESRKDFSTEKANSHSNLLDILEKTRAINILWRDNNSDSKGVANRVDYQDFRSDEVNPICDIECRDEGMLDALPAYIDAREGEDILIVLHQMGSHGPAYFKRYPQKFELFTPVCRTNELKDCSEDEINNTYDNTIVYTDYFLSRVINFLKKYDKTHEVAMVYVSDHGESLGEAGIYLHSMPYVLAPESQIKVPLILWFGSYMKNELHYEKIKTQLSQNYSHDHVFHTMLGMFEVKTELYNPQLDIFAAYRKSY